MGILDRLEQSVDRLAGSSRFAQLLGEAATPGRDWGQMVGQGQRPGLDFSRLISTPASNWGQLIGQGQGQGGFSFGGYFGSQLGQYGIGSYAQTGRLDMGWLDKLNAARVENAAAEEKKKAAGQPGAATPQNGGAAAPSPAGKPGLVPGMEPDVARWDAQAQATFGQWADTMLAIMTHESHGHDVQNAQGYPAYGLFQLWEQPGLTIDQQFVAAKKLLDEKLRDIENAYARNGLNPDERTRARDVALAWAGHFNYQTGLPNPYSQDIGSKQTAAELEKIFLANYDAIKAGRKAAAAAAPVTAADPYTGGAGPLASIWGGGYGPITQGFGVIDPSINQDIYKYGRDYGMTNGGHPGIDVGIPRGTRLYMPAGLTGKVLIAGGTQFFRDEDYGDQGTPGKGELRILLSNGDILILGHTSKIYVHEGDQLAAGMALGESGSANRDHLHLEVRKRLPNGSYVMVNPEEYFGGG